MMWLVTAMLLLQPVLESDTNMRLVARGPEQVEWHLDGQRIAVTNGSNAAEVRLPAGQHELWAVTSHDGPWRVLARPTEAAGPGVHYVEGWSAADDGVTEPQVPWPTIMVAIGLLALGIAARPKRP